MWHFSPGHGDIFRAEVCGISVIVMAIFSGQKYVAFQS